MRFGWRGERGRAVLDAATFAARQTRIATPRRRGGDGGESLVELLVSITILGILVPALALGIMTTVSTSATFKDSVAPKNNVSLILSNWSDAIDQAAFQTCAGAGWVPAAPIPAGSTSIASAPTVQYWDGAKFDPAITQSACNADANRDHGLQLITLTVTAAEKDAVVKDVQTLSVVKRNPCLSGCP